MVPIGSIASFRDVTGPYRVPRYNLRFILMTSLAFILGVVPLVSAAGAGAELRQSLGTAVFFGMLGVTGFGLIFTPVFYATVQRLFSRHSAALRAKVAM